MNILIPIQYVLESWVASNDDRFRSDFEAIGGLYVELRQGGRPLMPANLFNFSVNRGTLVVARNLLDDDKIVSMGCLCPRYSIDAMSGNIERVVTTKACRGLGLGRAVVTRLIEIARNKGMEEVRLSCDANDEPLNRFYLSLGFERTKSGTNSYRMALATPSN